MIKKDLICLQYNVNCLKVNKIDVIKNCALIIINNNIKQYNLKGNLFCKSYHNILNVESLTLTKHITVPSST